MGVPFLVDPTSGGCGFPLPSKRRADVWLPTIACRGLGKACPELWTSDSLMKPQANQKGDGLGAAFEATPSDPCERKDHLPRLEKTRVKATINVRHHPNIESFMKATPTRQPKSSSIPFKQRLPPKSQGLKQTPFLNKHDTLGPLQ